MAGPWLPPTPVRKGENLFLAGDALRLLGEEEQRRPGVGGGCGVTDCPAPLISLRTVSGDECDIGTLELAEGDVLEAGEVSEGSEVDVG